MTEIQNFNLYDSFRQGAGVGTEMRDRKTKSQLGQLFASAQTAPQDQRAGLLAQISQTGGMEAGVKAQEGLTQIDTNATSQMTQQARMVIAAAKSGNTDMAAQLYAPLAAQAKRMNFPVPDAFGDAVLQPLQTFIDAHPVAGQGQISNHVIGNALVDNSGHELYRGQAAPTPANLVNVPDGHGGFVQKIFDNRTRTFSDPNYDGGDAQEPDPAADPTADTTAQPGPAVSMGGQPFYSNVEASIAPFGGRITSTIGGKHNVGSLHPAGRAADVGMGRESPEQQAKILAALQANPNLLVRDERTHPPGQAVWGGPHLHVESRGGSGGGGGGGARMGYTPPKGTTDKPSALAEKLALAKEMGATPDQLKQMVLGGSAGQGVADVPGDPTKTGAEYLASLPPQMRGVVRAIANGDQAAPSASSRSPQAQALLQAVYAYDPTTNATNLPARTATRKDFTTGQSRKKMDALNQVAAHLELLDTQVGSVAGHSIPGIGNMVNKAENAYDRSSGKTGIIDWESTADAVAHETRALFAGAGGGTLAELEGYLRTLSANNSEPQKRAAIRNISRLASSRIEILQQAYTQGMGKTSNPFSTTFPHAAGVLSRLSGNAKTQKAAGGPKPGMIEDGHRFKGGNPADPKNWEAVR